MPRLEPGAGFDLEITEKRPGLLIFLATGRGAASLFAPESGGHRWQRIPPTEKRGRVHTSTITVAVLPLKSSGLQICARDIEWYATKSGGPGGQHVNKTMSAVVATHKPTGIVVRCESERSQGRNREIALAVLKGRVAEQYRLDAEKQRQRQRKDQVGTGQRGDKIRTVRLRDGVVTNHLNGKKISLHDYLQGGLLNIQ